MLRRAPLLALALLSLPARPIHANTQCGFQVFTTTPGAPTETKQVKQDATALAKLLVEVPAPNGIRLETLRQNGLHPTSEKSTISSDGTEWTVEEVASLAELSGGRRRTGDFVATASQTLNGQEIARATVNYAAKTTPKGTQLILKLGFVSRKDGSGAKSGWIRHGAELDGRGLPINQFEIARFAKAFGIAPGSKASADPAQALRSITFENVVSADAALELAAATARTGKSPETLIPDLEGLTWGRTAAGVLGYKQAPGGKVEIRGGMPLGDALMATASKNPFATRAQIEKGFRDRIADINRTLPDDRKLDWEKTNVPTGWTFEMPVVPAQR